MVYTNCCMVYTIQKWYIPWGNLPDGLQTPPSQPGFPPVSQLLTDQAAGRRFAAAGPRAE